MASSYEILYNAMENDLTKDDLIAMSKDYFGTPDFQQYIIAAQNIDVVSAGTSMVGDLGMGGGTYEAWDYLLATKFDWTSESTGYDWQTHFTTILEEGGLNAYSVTLDFQFEWAEINKILHPEEYTGGTFDPISSVTDFVSDTWESIEDTASTAYEDFTEISDGAMAEFLEVTSTFGVNYGSDVLEEFAETIGWEEGADLFRTLGENIDESFDLLTEGMTDAVIKGLFTAGYSTFEEFYENLGEFGDQIGETVGDLSEDIFNIISPDIPEAGEGTDYPVIDFGLIEGYRPPQRYGRAETIYSQLPQTFDEKTFVEKLPEAKATPINEIIGNSLI